MWISSISHKKKFPNQSVKYLEICLTDTGKYWETCWSVTWKYHEICKLIVSWKNKIHQKILEYFRQELFVHDILLSEISKFNIKSFHHLFLFFAATFFFNSWYFSSISCALVLLQFPLNLKKCRGYASENRAPFFIILKNKFWILEDRIWIIEGRFWILMGRFWILMSRFWILKSRFWILKSTSQIFKGTSFISKASFNI